MITLGRRLALLALSAGLLASCGQAGAAGSHGARSSSGAGPAPRFADGGLAFGNPKATVTVVEYASASCTHCARWDQDVFPAFRAKYIATGKVRYVFREFVTPPEQLAAGAFLLARCAGPAKYMGVVEAVFRVQPQIFQTGDMRTPLLNIARSVGLNDGAFTACISDADALKALNDRVQHAVDVDHVNGTPTILVNGKQVGDGETTMAQMDAAIQPLLN